MAICRQRTKGNRIYYRMLVGVVDSGIGGQNVVREIERALPNRFKFIYFGDTEFAPYGNKPLDLLRARLKSIVEKLIAEGAQVIVLACNTATATSLSYLKSLFSVPIFGVTPTVSQKLEPQTVVFCTPHTARFVRERYPRAAVAEDDRLSVMLEKSAPHFHTLRPYIYKLCAPYARTHSIAYLGCTHYLFAAHIFSEIFETVTWDYSELIETLRDLSAKTTK